MTTHLDYSDGHLSGIAVLGVGGPTGVIRYAGTPGRTKNTTVAEVASMHAAGIAVHAVYENSPSDFTGSYVAGVTNAKALLQDATNCGITGVLFVSVDQHLQSYQIATWVQYVQGAASVLGSRLGVYGFSEAVIAARPYASFFWQCGSSPSATNTASFVNVWQRNSGQSQITVAGISCDVNDVFISLTVTTPPYPTNVEGLLTMTTTSDAEALIWRVEALISGTATVVDGPTKGEVNAVATLKADLDSLRTDLAAAEWRLDALIKGLTTVEDGPTKGENNVVATTLAAIRTKLGA